jgi:hypothetical protein
MCEKQKGKDMIRIKIGEEVLVDFFLSEQSAEERVLKNNLNNCLNSIKKGGNYECNTANFYRNFNNSHFRCGL